MALRRRSRGAGRAWGGLLTGRSVRSAPAGRGVGRAPAVSSSDHREDRPSDPERLGRGAPSPAPLPGLLPGRVTGSRLPQDRGDHRTARPESPRVGRWHGLSATEPPSGRCDRRHGAPAGRSARRPPPCAPPAGRRPTGHGSPRSPGWGPLPRRRPSRTIRPDGSTTSAGHAGRRSSTGAPTARAPAIPVLLPPPRSRRPSCTSPGRLGPGSSPWQ
jgi:hypothetical protein